MNAHAATFLPQARPAPAGPAAPPDLAGSLRAPASRLLAAARDVSLSIAVPALLLGFILLCAIAPAAIAPWAPTDMDQGAILQHPNIVHPLGTDHLGRDIFSLLIYGARQSVQTGLGAVLVGTVIGGSIGLAAGYAGRAIDMLLMRFIDMWMSIPDILLVLIIATALKPSPVTVLLTIGLVSAPRYARVMRAQVMAVKGLPFVTASRAIGASHQSILFRHILPHSLSQMLVLATLGVASAALMGASLSFIGVGVAEDQPDWGYLLSQGRSYLTVAWWFGAFPGLAITTFVISANLLGDALRHRLDPRSRGR